MALDNKYGRVTTEFGDIGESEVVVIFRAQDTLLPKVLKVYRYFCELVGSPQHHLAAIDEAADQVKTWQLRHSDRVRVPNSNAYVMRVARERNFPGTPG